MIIPEYLKTILATFTGGLLAAGGSLYLYHCQVEDNNKKEMIGPLLVSYGNQKECFSQARPKISKMFEQGMFTENIQSFNDVSSYAQKCKFVGNEFYFQLIRLKVINKEDRSDIRKCIISTFEQYGDLRFKDLKENQVDLVDLNKKYIQPQIDCSLKIFQTIDTRIESALN
jgi:hypothetical protein